MNGVHDMAQNGVIDDADDFKSYGRRIFCKRCFNLLDLPNSESIMVCSQCNEMAEFELISQANAAVTESTYVRALARQRKNTTGFTKEKAQRATVEDPCPKCDNPIMTFYTMQMRSVDEGQTCFYECPKCGHKYSTNT